MRTIRTIATTPSSAKRVGQTEDSRGPCSDRCLVSVSALLIQEIKRIIKDSEIMKEDDSKWPQKNKDGRQELEIRIGSEHIQFEVRNPARHNGCI